MGLFSREPKPHVTYEVEVKHKKLRMVLIVILLAIGVVAITSGIMALLNTDPGWQEVTANAQEQSVGGNFIFQYYFSNAGASATELNQKVSAVYDEATVKAYWLFTPDEESAEYKNIWYINHHPGEAIAVDPVLYQAFEKLQGSRYLYLGPAYAEYNSLCFNPDDAQVFAADPAVNAENRAYVQKIAAFAADPDAIHLELLGNNTVKLTVSEEYLAFAREYEIDCFLDFHYMTNAFVIDYLAQSLMEQELTQGYLVSVDGYTRNLWQGGDLFKMNLFDLDGTTIYPAATFGYRGPMNIVSLRDFPIAASNAYYRVGAQQRVLHPYLSLQTGMPMASTHAVVALSEKMGCADMLLQLLPVYIAETLDETALRTADFDCIWFQNTDICYTDKDLTFTDLFTDTLRTYKPELKK